jgi:hypothetical protein
MGCFGRVADKPRQEMRRPLAFVCYAFVLSVHWVTGRLAISGKKVSRTFCAKHPEGEILAKGIGHLFLARSLVT